MPFSPAISTTHIDEMSSAFPSPDPSSSSSTPIHNSPLSPTSVPSINSTHSHSPPPSHVNSQIAIPFTESQLPHSPINSPINNLTSITPESYISHNSAQSIASHHTQHSLSLFPSPNPAQSPISPDSPCHIPLSHSYSQSPPSSLGAASPNLSCSRSTSSSPCRNNRSRSPSQISESRSASNSPSHRTRSRSRSLSKSIRSINHSPALRRSCSLSRSCSSSVNCSPYRSRSPCKRRYSSQSHSPSPNHSPSRSPSPNLLVDHSPCSKVLASPEHGSENSYTYSPVNSVTSQGSSTSFHHHSDSDKLISQRGEDEEEVDGPYTQKDEIVGEEDEDEVVEIVPTPAFKRKVRKEAKKAANLSTLDLFHQHTTAVLESTPDSTHSLPSLNDHSMVSPEPVVENKSEALDRLMDCYRKQFENFIENMASTAYKEKLLRSYEIAQVNIFQIYML